MQYDLSLLDSLNSDIPYQQAVSAFNGTSFSPEKRAQSHIDDYVATMRADFERLKAQAEKGGTLNQLAEAFAAYRQGYAQRYRAWLNSHSRCISWMITGPARFPTSRAQKWNRAADNRLQDLIAYREHTIRKIVRELRPDLRPIMSGDADAIERLALQLVKLERQQELMKKANAAIRKHRKEGQERQRLELVALGMSPKVADVLLTPDRVHGVGFPGYELTNNGANIRRVKQRLEHLEAMHAKPVVSQEKAGVTLEEDPPANRVRLFFPGKPETNVRDGLKSHGFRWTPSMECWQAYMNHRAVTFARAFVASLEATA